MSSLSPRSYSVVLEPDPDGGYVAIAPAFPGCYSQGETVEEALANVREAILLTIEDMEAGQSPIQVAKSSARSRSADSRGAGAAFAYFQAMASNDLHSDLHGWWRIVETSQWVNEYLDDLGPALISITGHGDRLRMHCLLAYVKVRPTKTGAAFTWEGAWEYDPMSGTGSVRLGKGGRLRGLIKIKDGDESTFIAERTERPAEPIRDPPSYRDKWGRRR